MFSKTAIPNAFTLSNLLLGVICLIYTIDGNYQLAAGLIIVAMVLDGMDGRIARSLKATSQFGKELDSLADLVSFGVAPAILTYSAYLTQLGPWSILFPIAFSLCGAIRLARFNVLNITTHFVGVPITAAGSLLALFILIGDLLPTLFFPIVVALLSYLMISNFKVPKI